MEKGLGITNRGLSPIFPYFLPYFFAQAHQISIFGSILVRNERNRRLARRKLLGLPLPYIDRTMRTDTLLVAIQTKTVSKGDELGRASLC